MTERPSAPARAMLRAIDWYQRAAEGRPSPCRFTPSCSEYAREAVEIYGAGRGGWLAARRLGRCRPFGRSGYDPVPEPCAHDHGSTLSPSSSARPEKVI